ncbi:MAG: hypothetical protein ACOX9B_04700 [Candidatus Xenobium sp.]
MRSRILTLLVVLTLLTLALASPGARGGQPPEAQESPSPSLEEPPAESPSPQRTPLALPSPEVDYAPSEGI